MPATKRVLIIEDNPEVGMYTSLLIEMSGLAVPALVTDGLEGLVACFREPPDVLVLDLDLPSMRGEDVLRFLRASTENRHLPIIIISALPEAKRRELELLKMGADSYMEKPLLENTFLDTLRRLLNREETVRGVAPPDSTANNSSRGFIEAILAQELKEELPIPRPEHSPPPVEEREIVELPQPGNGSENADEPGDLTADEPFEGYRLIKIIGAGGMGTVYKAEQVKLQRIVALKVLLENLHSNQMVRERFQREALIMAQVNHPNIVQVYETGNTQHTSYFSMEYVDGPSLGRRIRKGSLEWVECVEVIRQTCEAISHLHSRGIIHRDIKPSNILLSRWGQVKITDFGISRARLMNEMKEFTQVLQFMGTPEYMAPELNGLTTASEQSDLYALGMTFWRMFAGAEVKIPGTPLHEVHPEIPRPLSAAIARCIQPDPRKRFATVDDARDAILNACKDLPEETPADRASATA